MLSATSVCHSSSHAITTHALTLGTTQSCCLLRAHRCGDLISERAKYEDRTDPAAREHLKRIAEEQMQHDADHLGERAYAEDAWFKGEEFPHRVTAMSMDAPTEYQFDVPVQQRTSHDPVKSLDGAKKWSSKVVGVMVAGWGELAFVARDGLGSGANLSCTVLYVTFLAMVAAGRTLGSSFNVLLDNTSADNKNNAVIFFLGWLVAIGAFEEASAFMMMKGHTYSRIDQSFRTLIVRMRSVAVWTVSMLLTVIFECLQPYDPVAVEELHHLWDWKAFFQDAIHEEFSGFATGQYGSGMHEIRCRKDHNGDVRVWFRKSSRSSTWFPDEGGYLMFKHVPEGPPAIAMGHPDRKWNREVVENTIRKWFGYMQVSHRALAKIRTEWEVRFDGLPPNGDTSLLADEHKLQWRTLPRRAPVSMSSSFVGSHRHATSDALENPPVNPITGPGRSAADVAREVDSYRSFMRRNNGSEMNNYPIFQADFLLIRHGSQLVLHRVTHGLMIEDAQSEKLSFTTTEYEHTPQQGVPGLFGTFLPKVRRAIVLSRAVRMRL